MSVLGNGDRERERRKRKRERKKETDRDRQTEKRKQMRGDEMRCNDENKVCFFSSFSHQLIGVHYGSEQPAVPGIPLWFKTA